MADKDKSKDYGYQPVQKRYQPNKDKLDPKDPPRGGSGVPEKEPAPKKEPNA